MAMFCGAASLWLEDEVSGAGQVAAQAESGGGSTPGDLVVPGRFPAATRSARFTARAA
jgi:hypothetical protein